MESNSVRKCEIMCLGESQAHHRQPTTHQAIFVVQVVLFGSTFIHVPPIEVGYVETPSSSPPTQRRKAWMVWWLCVFFSFSLSTTAGKTSCVLWYTGTFPLVVTMTPRCGWSDQSDVILEVVLCFQVVPTNAIIRGAHLLPIYSHSRIQIQPFQCSRYIQGIFRESFCRPSFPWVDCGLNLYNLARLVP